MSDRVLVAVLTLCVPVLAPPMAVAGQATTPTRESWSAPQTSWGHPDLRGTWSNTTRTPLQRPADLEGKEFLTEEEWAERAVPEVDNMFVSPSMPTGGYNQDVWLEKGELSQADLADCGSTRRETAAGDASGAEEFERTN